MFLHDWIWENVCNSHIQFLNFALVTCQIYLCETFRNCKPTIPLKFLKVSNLYAIPCGFLNKQNWMYELCMPVAQILIIQKNNASHHKKIY